MVQRTDPIPEVGELRVGLRPTTACVFRASPARSLHAALLRRVELVSAALARELHEIPEDTHAPVRPWTVSGLIGPMERTAEGLVAGQGSLYHVRVTALTSRLIEVLTEAFNEDSALGREPLVLEHVPFQVMAAETAWTNLATYASLLTYARPERSVTLDFRSPTSFRSEKTGGWPEPRRCLEGYLRKWEAFAPLELPTADILAYAQNNITLTHHELRPANVRLGRYAIQGVVGHVHWSTDGDGSPGLLRYVNALADFAPYCGTGMKTSLGMGQTVRVRRRSPVRTS